MPFSADPFTMDRIETILEQIEDNLGNLQSAVDDIYIGKKRKRTARAVDLAVTLYHELIEKNPGIYGMIIRLPKTPDGVFDSNKAAPGFVTTPGNPDKIIRAIVAFFDRLVFSRYIDDLPRDFLWEMSNHYKGLITIALCMIGTDLGRMSKRDETFATFIPMSLLYVANVVDGEKGPVPSRDRGADPFDVHEALVANLPRYVKMFKDSFALARK